MANESRVKKSFLNARVNFLCYLVVLFISFYTRKIFLEKLGTDFIGLTGTLSSLLGFLNLAELGVGSAIGYVLYKPISDGDRVKINEVISVFGYLYRWIGFFILGAGIVLSVFIPLIFPDTIFQFGVIYMGYYAYLASSMIGYFVNYRSVLLGADQRNYIVTGYFQLTNIIRVLIQMVLAIYIQNFYLYFALELIFGIINSIILNWKINIIYPWLKSEICLGRQLFKKYPEIGKYVKQLFLHKIGAFVYGQITPFLIYAYVALPVVALYGNYTTITQKVQGLVLGVLDSTGAGVGNLISEGDNQKSYKIYQELFSVRFWISAILTFCFFRLSNPFILLWLGEEYLMSSLIIALISAQFFLSFLRVITDQFLFGYGLFYDVWAPVVESILFVAVATIAGTVWGLSGVLCGPIVSTIIVIYIWKPYFLFTKGFKKSYLTFALFFIVHSIPMLLAYSGTDYVVDRFFSDKISTYSWINWIIESAMFTTIISVSSFVLLYPISSGLRSFVHRFIHIRR